MKVKKVVLLLHSVHGEITSDEAHGAVPRSWRVCGEAKVCPASLSLDATRGVDWHQLARLQRAEWEEKVRPLLKNHHPCSIAYFGLAPVPLAFHLGSLTEGWSGIHPFLRHHVTREWRYFGGKGPKVRYAPVLRDTTRSAEPALIEITTTVPSDIEAARLAVGPTSAEVSLCTDPLGDDVLTSERAVQGVAQEFRKLVAMVEQRRPNAREIHVVGAMPVGLAFLLGAQVTPTRSTQLVTYQYFRSSEPRFVEAIRIPERRPSSVSIGEAERRMASAVRREWELERKKLVEFANDSNGHWSSILGPFAAAARRGDLAALDSARATPLLAEIDFDHLDGTEFSYDTARKRWMLSDNLIVSICRGVPKEQQARAGRMLLLHEALHHGKQGLDECTARQIRMAPKVLEQLDYLADTWAMLHELAFCAFLDRPWEEQRAELQSVVNTATATMWAFDASAERGVLEVRRISRYLIWYLMAVRLEHAASLDEALQVFTSRPFIELVGPPTQLRDGRLVMLLSHPPANAYELCWLDKTGRLRRAGVTAALPIDGIVADFGAHNGPAIRDHLRALGQDA